MRYPGDNTLGKNHLKEVSSGRLDKFPIGSIVALGNGNTLYNLISKSTGMVHLLEFNHPVSDAIIVPGYRHAAQYRWVREEGLPLFTQGELF